MQILQSRLWRSGRKRLSGSKKRKAKPEPTLASSPSLSTVKDFTEIFPGDAEVGTKQKLRKSKSHHSSRHTSERPSIIVINASPLEQQSVLSGALSGSLPVQWFQTRPELMAEKSKLHSKQSLLNSESSGWHDVTLVGERPAYIHPNDSASLVSRPSIRSQDDGLSPWGLPVVLMDAEYLPPRQVHPFEDSAHRFEQEETDEDEYEDAVDNSTVVRSATVASHLTIFRGAHTYAPSTIPAVEEETADEVDDVLSELPVAKLRLDDGYDECITLLAAPSRQQISSVVARANRYKLVIVVIYMAVLVSKSSNSQSRLALAALYARPRAHRRRISHSSTRNVSLPQYSMPLRRVTGFPDWGF